MDTLSRAVRKFVYDRFQQTSHPPVAEEIARQFEIDRHQAVETLQSLQAERMLALTPGTARILMAHPFSALTTPYRVTLPSGQRFFANCAYDAVNIQLALKEPVQIDSFCYHCCEPIQIDLADEAVRSARPQDPVIYFGLPFAHWWDDIIHTCSNTMLFFSSRKHFDAWLDTDRAKAGEVLKLEQVIELGGPLSKGRMDLNYQKPSASELSSHFKAMGLTGEFWAVG